MNDPLNTPLNTPLNGGIDVSKPIVDEPPPALGTWPRVYISVLAYLAVVIVIFYLLTRRLAP